VRSRNVQPKVAGAFLTPQVTKCHRGGCRIPEIQSVKAREQTLAPVGLIPSACSTTESWPQTVLAALSSTWDYAFEAPVRLTVKSGVRFIPKAIGYKGGYEQALSLEINCGSLNFQGSSSIESARNAW